MSVRADIRVDLARTLGEVNPRVYGQFLELIGRAIYGGVVDPGSPHADAEGVRLDALDAARGLRPTVVRWPGGNFASGYHWRDGIGPVEDRPLRRDLAWAALEPNLFGTEEFLAYTRRLGAEAYLNLNVSTGTVDEALGWVEYCNADDPLPEVRLRRQGPHPGPHGVRVWGIGNENYGWWQHGHSSAAEYAAVAREWGKLLRWADPSLELVAVGATDEPAWNWTILSEAGRFIDLLSLHFYWRPDEQDPYYSILAGPLQSEFDIVATWGMCLAAQRKLGLPAPTRLAIDEWGVWAHTNPSAQADVAMHDVMRGGVTARNGFDVRFEEDYNLRDALAVASWLHVLWRHPEKVGLATQAQLINVVAPIHVHDDGILLHTIYYPLALARAHAGPISLDVHTVCTDDVPGPAVLGGRMSAVDVAGTCDPAAGRIHLSIVNRSLDKEAELVFHGLDGEWNRAVLSSDESSDGNSIAHPDAVVPSHDRVSLDEPFRVPPHAHVTLYREH